MTDNNYLKNVRTQYEELPYPERDPQDEKKRIRMTIYDGIDRINHICHGGRKDFTKSSRILIAGGGTGDSTIFLAEQLRHSDCDIVYLDFSKASLDIAKERANIRGLNNITWIHDSILNIPDLNLGKFDHINCSGVLHHLESPDEGLRALESVLSDKGSLHLMLYGQYGRTVIYQIQDLLKLSSKNANTDEKINICRKLMSTFHDNHWYQFVKHAYTNLRDIELYDLFLHSQDRAYTVPQLYEFIESAGLKINKLLFSGQSAGNYLYEPRFYIQDETLLETIDELPEREQQAIAELMNGLIGKHELYVTHDVKESPTSNMLDFIPSLPVTTTTVKEDYMNAYQAASSPGDNIIISAKISNANVISRKTPHVAEFFKHLDGKKTLREIYSLIIADSSDSSLSTDLLSTEFEELFFAMDQFDYLLLRHESIPPYRTAEEIQRQLTP